MRYSVFTPTNDPQFLGFAYESLLGQTDQDWEWVIVENNGAEVLPFSDERVRIIHYDHRNVGALKWHACQQARGDWLVELDHDDALLPTCLEEIGKSSADFVYSNTVQVDMDWMPVLWGTTYGWTWREVDVMGHHCKEAVSPEPYPSNLSRIWFAPNHVRAWKRDFYMRIGGHDEGMHISDDHDLVARSYLNGTIEHIDKPLYLYRVHGQNTWLQHGDEIDETMWDNHDRYFIPLVERWCELNGYPKADLGGAHNPPPGWESWDIDDREGMGSTRKVDLNDTWPADDQSIGLLRAHEIFEHLPDSIRTMNEAWRVLVHGGVLDLMVPSTTGMGAFCDPTHKSFWNLRSLRYYTEEKMRNYLGDKCICKFQRVWTAERQEYEGIPMVRAHLLAIHDGPRIHGQLDFTE